MGGQDRALRERAAQVIPGGMYGHMATTLAPASAPQFYAKAEGCRLWDVDGREYVDLLFAADVGLDPANRELDIVPLLKQRAHRLHRALHACCRCRAGAQTQGAHGAEKLSHISIPVMCVNYADHPRGVP